MGDQLENFFRENREEFDEVPRLDSEKRWQSIEGKLARQPLQLGWMWKAASILLLFTTAWLLFDRNSESETRLSGNQYEEFLQAEAYYTSLIDEKRLEIDQHPSNELKKSFQSELDELDELYKELKVTFEKSTNDEQLLDAMIVNLQLRINILNQQLNILKTLNKVENETVQNI